MFQKIFWFITRIVCFFTLVCFSFGYLLKPKHWLVGFLQLGIQVGLLLSFLLFLYWIFKSKLRSFYPLGVLLLGFPYLQRSVQFKKPSPIGTVHNLSILNYNVARFQSDYYYASQDPSKTLKSIHFVSDFKADLKCFQDFYNWDETPNTGSIKQINKKGTPHFVAAKPKKSTNANQGSLGLIIFSKYPLKYINQHMFGVNGNGILVADMLHPNGKLRIINVQLQSMGVRVGKVVQKDMDRVKQESKNVLSNLKTGFKLRFEQVAILNNEISESPYPVILCGDLNEVPYGNAYGTIRKKLVNAFELKGNGFGFTLNRSPRFVRIDNIFCDPSLKIKSFETLSDTYSDHFPLYSELEIPKL
jgi:endonuclease/exonuclease/phosphatase family metal-dependent hydrolase